MKPLEFTLHDDPPAADAAVVDQGLGHANEQAAPMGDVKRLACFARSAGRVVGGAVGRTWGECCELQQLWVDADQRRKGVGTLLVREFERGAAGRGCRTYYLETFSFQALDFYRGLGYEPKLDIKGFPLGITKYVMLRKSS